MGKGRRVDWISLIKEPYINFCTVSTGRSFVDANQTGENNPKELSFNSKERHWLVHGNIKYWLKKNIQMCNLSKFVTFEDETDTSGRFFIYF